jgi:hypothetical protein
LSFDPIAFIQPSNELANDFDDMADFFDDYLESPLRRSLRPKYDTGIKSVTVLKAALIDMYDQGVPAEKLIEVAYDLNKAMAVVAMMVHDVMPADHEAVRLAYSVVGRLEYPVMDLMCPPRLRAKTPRNGGPEIA